jgi:MFS superfamily sulfate permease-like transporter
MLAGIGIIIFLKQIPHAFGYDKDYEGDTNFSQPDGENTFTEIWNLAGHILPGAITITLVALGILILWEKVLSKKHKIFTVIPGPFVAVLFGVLFYALVPEGSFFSLSTEHLVKVPVPESISDFYGQLRFPNFGEIGNADVWIVGITIALVASIETLLSVEATDKLDPDKRTTPTNRELVAQGIGNICSGFIGGLPITQVIVRSSANIQSGGKTKLSTIVHGILLLLSVAFIPVLLNMIPLAVLAAVLLLVGYKLANPSKFIKMYNLGYRQFVPFIVTVLGLVFTDLLIGVGLGLVVGIITILLQSYNNSHFLHKTSEIKNHFKIRMAEEVTFLNKGAILRELNNIPEDSFLEIDVRKSVFLDYDIVELLDDFSVKAKDKKIDIKIISERGVVENPASYEQFFKREKVLLHDLNKR